VKKKSLTNRSSLSVSSTPLRSRRPVRVLLTEGSSVSARQAIYALGYAGAAIEVCDPKPLLCLARFSRFVRACYACPSFTRAPAAYVEFLTERLRRGSFDVLFPVHDETYLLSRFRDHFSSMVGLAVADFASFERLQSKAEFVKVLRELDLPHPKTDLVRTRAQLENQQAFPYYIKLAYSTAGQGVWFVSSVDERNLVADRLEIGALLNRVSEILVQQPAPGVLGVVQCVFDEGRLVAGHCYQALALGVGGSARIRIGVDHPVVLAQVSRLAAHLRWHGALTFDYLWDASQGRPAYIDSNPRIGETLNATLGGVNLCAALLKTALKAANDVPPSPNTPVRTHNTLLTLLASASRGCSRRSLVAELLRALLHRAPYANSQDEMVRPREDYFSLLPAAWLTGQVLLEPARAESLIKGTVEHYALTEKAARAIRNLRP
jgi:predicted ATP-grasp superfamily ATP-dependent carboligase